jgi:hypothetical protein
MDAPTDGSGVSQLLLDVDRLAVAGSLACRSMSTDELVAATGRDRRLVLTAIGDLRAAGLVVVEPDDRYGLDVDALRSAAKLVAELSIPMDPAIGFGMTDTERSILERHFSGRVLSRIPSSRAKLIVVLQRLALEFDVSSLVVASHVTLQIFNLHWVKPSEVLEVILAYLESFLYSFMCFWVLVFY